MALQAPTTSVLDSFDRADGALGSPWVDNAWGDPATWTVASNVAAPASATGSGIAWDGSAYGGDCEFGYTLPTLFSSTAFHEIRATTSTGSFSGYQLQITATGAWTWFRSDAGVNTNLGGITGLTRAVGSSTCVQANGSTMAAWYRPSGGAWTPVVSRVDTTYSAGGFFGIEAVDTSARINDFFGGSIIPTPLVPRRMPLGA